MMSLMFCAMSTPITSLGANSDARGNLSSRGCKIYDERQVKKYILILDGATEPVGTPMQKDSILT
jgi:hypothetical protein